MCSLSILTNQPMIIQTRAISFVLAIFLFAFKNFQVNVQTIIILAFLVGTLLSCIWVVFQLSAWEQLVPKSIAQILKGKGEGDDSSPNVVASETVVKLAFFASGINQFKEAIRKRKRTGGTHQGTAEQA